MSDVTNLVASDLTQIVFMGSLQDILEDFVVLILAFCPDEEVVNILFNTINISKRLKLWLGICPGLVKV